MWLLASVVTWLGHSQGLVHAVLVVLASAALALWVGGGGVAWGESLRRLLGVAVLAWLAFALVRLG